MTDISSSDPLSRVESNAVGASDSVVTPLQDPQIDTGSLSTETRNYPAWLIPVINSDGSSGGTSPFTLLNDWFRRNLHQSEVQPIVEYLRIPSASIEDMRSTDVPLSHGSDDAIPTTTPLDTQSIHSSVSRTSRPSFSEQDQNFGVAGGDYSSAHAVFTSTGRNHNATIIDLHEMNDADWPAEQNPPTNPPPDGNDNPSEGNITPERTAAEILRHSPQAKAFLAILERYLPFALILLIKGILDHGSGITVFLGLVVTFSHANSLVRKEVTKQSKRSLPFLGMIIINLAICICCLYYVFQNERLYPALIFMPTSLTMNSVHSLLWLLIVTDYVVKFLTVIFKCIIIMLPERIVPFQRRGKYYLFIETSSQLYRSLLPIYPWLMYLFEAYDGSLKIFSVLLCVFYLSCKIVADVMVRVKIWRVALTKFLQHVHYGTVPSCEELIDLFCPICHDSFTNPTKLSCGHIFCEDCVTTWLDRGERSCPMCRARVVEDTSWRDGGTSQFIQTF